MCVCVRACVRVCVREDEPHCRAQSLSRLCSPRLFANNDSDNRQTDRQTHTHSHTHTFSTQHAITFKKKFGLAVSVKHLCCENCENTAHALYILIELKCIMHVPSACFPPTRIRVAGKPAHDPRTNARQAAGKTKNPLQHVCMHSENTLERSDTFGPVCVPLSSSCGERYFFFSKNFVPHLS